MDKKKISQQSKGADHKWLASTGRSKIGYCNVLNKVMKDSSIEKVKLQQRLKELSSCVSMRRIAETHPTYSRVL